MLACIPLLSCLQLIVCVVWLINFDAISLECMKGSIVDACVANLSTVLQCCGSTD
eukprot:COSAG02_NODE_199_length_29529_cov_32.558289_19_plen_55_part_00